MTSNTSDPSSVIFGMISKYKNEGIDSFLQIETCLAIYSRCQIKSKILENLNFNIEKKNERIPVSWQCAEILGVM